jgi:hypothetical protein
MKSEVLSRKTDRPLTRDDTFPQGFRGLEAGARDFINLKSVDQEVCMAELTVRLEGDRP